MKLITGVKGEAHITPMQDAMWHRGIAGVETCSFGSGGFIPEATSNNEINIHSGIGMMQGRFFCVEPNTYDTVTVGNGTQGEKRIDLICARITADNELGTQEGSWQVIQGESTTGTPVMPSGIDGDLDNGDTVADASWIAVELDGINIVNVYTVFQVWQLPITSGGIGGNTAGTHNSIFRGKDLTDIYTLDDIYSRIENGTFDDLYIGDCFDISITSTLGGAETVRCMIAGFDIYLHCGDTALTQHHAVIVPMNSFTTAAYMNASNTSAGGYTGSYMHKTVLPKYQTALEAVFGTHLLTYRAILTSGISTSGTSMAGAGLAGYANGWAWTDVKLRLMSEPELYGCMVCSSSLYDVGIAKSQLPLFALAPEYIRAGLGGIDHSARYAFWLAAVASSAAFAYCDSNGVASYTSASVALGVRPVFLIG